MVRGCWIGSLTLVNIFLKEFGVILNKNFFFNLSFSDRLRDNFIKRFTHINLYNWIIDKGRFIISKRYKDSLLIHEFGSKSKWKLIGMMENILIENSKIRVISYRGINKWWTIYIYFYLHWTQNFLKWYKISKILFDDSYLRTWFWRSHLLTQMTKGTRILCVSTPSGRGRLNSY